MARPGEGGSRHTADQSSPSDAGEREDPGVPADGARSRDGGDRLLTVGVISDTHGLVRPEALEALRGSDLILHAGDIGKPEVLASLGAIAPVIAVRGNNDRGDWANDLPDERLVRVSSARAYLIHDLKQFDRERAPSRLTMVVSGHSHRPGIERRDGILYLNPGSAGPRRFKLPVSLARCHVDGERIRARLIELSV